ncbi:hypothetical protein [Aureivirga sp. CE67]|uniref:hypothetical protein n=1 Tax=Aureivirga sp. CE67 TaxID=1788983 RepID=UPI0018CAD302|nr:hypothetical protein [Aureivirga sp. CE67]
MKKTTIFTLINIAFFVIFTLAYFKYDNYTLFMMLAFIPYFISGLFLFRKYLKSLDDKNFVMLTKSNFDYLNIAFLLFIISLSWAGQDMYLYILSSLAFICLVLNILISKKRILNITKEGVFELGKGKHRKIEEITSLNIFPNNVEITFNKNEILQINKHELVKPKWEEFLENIHEMNNKKEKIAVE